MSINHAQDAMIRRHEKELEERSSAAQAIIANAQDNERDLNDSEKETLGGLRTRMGEIQGQLNELESTRDLTEQVYARARQVDQAITTARRVGSTTVEYRSAGAYFLDMYQSHLGDRSATERLDVFLRAAAHQKTSDNLGVVPDPIIGGVLNFIDQARPMCNILGVRPLPSATWYRPKVTQHTTVGKQGSAGAAADEKAELSSQKMTITRLTGTAVTYGGYVNVSRQDIDLSSPNMLDIVIGDLAAQYAVQTEAALGTALAATANTIEIAGTGAAAFTSANLTGALWTAAANLYTATKGAGRPVLAVAPDQIGNWGSTFAPVNPQNAQSEGFYASNYGQGVIGYVTGIPVIVSAGLASGVIGVVFNTAAVEVYEQRVGQLQVVEPSVLGLQVAYAGYFTPMIVETGGVQKLINLA